MSDASKVGRCRECRHGYEIRARRSVFWRCDRSKMDPAYPRYPRLPVIECAGYQPRQARDTAEDQR